MPHREQAKKNGAIDLMVNSTNIDLRRKTVTLHTRRNRKRNQEGHAPERWQNECHSGLSIAYFSADLMANIAFINHKNVNLLLRILNEVRKRHWGTSKGYVLLAHISKKTQKERLERIRKTQKA